MSVFQVAVSNLDLVLLEARSAFDQLSPHLLGTLECLYKAVLAFAEDLVPSHGQPAEPWEPRWHAARPSASSMSCGERCSLFSEATLPSRPRHEPSFAGSSGCLSSEATCQCQVQCCKATPRISSWTQPMNCLQDVISHACVAVSSSAHLLRSGVSSYALAAYHV